MGKLKFCVHGLIQPYRHFGEADYILHENVWDEFCYRTVCSVVASSKLLSMEHSYEIGMNSVVRIGQEEGKNVLSDCHLCSSCFNMGTTQ